MYATLKSSHLGTFAKFLTNLFEKYSYWKATRVIQVKWISQRYGWKWSTRNCGLEDWVFSLLLVFDLVLLQTVAVRQCAQWQTFLRSWILSVSLASSSLRRRSLIVHCETHNVTTHWSHGLGDTTVTVYLSNKRSLLDTAGVFLLLLVTILFTGQGISVIRFSHNRNATHFAHHYVIILK